MQRLDVSRWARRYNRRPTTLDSLFTLAFALVLAALALALTYSHHTISCILGRMRPPITPDGSPPSIPFHSCSPTHGPFFAGCSRVLTYTHIYDVPIGFDARSGYCRECFTYGLLLRHVFITSTYCLYAALALQLLRPQFPRAYML